ncbi:leucine--tRNA ligase [Clostridium sp. 'deep sea']|uniref:leucine--tRNA ligase n=1 Tax=Clostridium sp. 'deep sea' TaxID=2779445 RepID=UPI0018966F56|nr:leucine--tRNA ligase [Clostridium sp. 'deep sea']QOR34704.1 leucine--tRNA ligase [Clostridium sp. 'deep sea']
MENSYSRQTDLKWQQIWQDTNLYNFKSDNIDKKFYCLEMFSYPSGSKLHLGHWYNYGLTDSFARLKRMQGYEVFEPMGFDAFGLPAENYAIKTGIHPKTSTENNVKTMQKQLRSMGAMFDWDYELATCEPNYYKWTQWLFLQLYKNDLAYRSDAPVNWCPSCQTVLANEQVVNGFCERCDAEIIRKDMTQWFFRITKYADELLAGLDDLDWPSRTIAAQKNWIGKSVGAEIKFEVCGENNSFKVFTTRADTLLGVSYVVLAPEHKLVAKITTKEQAEAVKEYQLYARKQSEIERMSTDKEKTGVFTGAYAVHPLTGDKIPIWISDYVLASYGTGAVMAVPAHDTRDFEFATKFKLPIPRVIKGKNNNNDDLPFTEYGVMVNSEEFNGLSSEQGKKAVVEKLAKKQAGEFSINFRLRDWSISRQRYWGAPIPIIHCDKCGMVPVPEKDLPVTLPFDVDYKPQGKAPLATNEQFINTTCPICGAKAKRDPNTLDTFVDSSWYFLRYPDNNNENKPWDIDLVNKMLPVDKYVGGPEHACMHLLYARFITKALRDLGYLNFDEPFKSLTHQGIILGPDGKRMSKSKGNVVSPDRYIEENGSDVLRLFLAFGFAYTEGGPWDEKGIKAIVRFVERVERLIKRVNQLSMSCKNTSTEMGKAEKDLNYIRHYAIKGVSIDAARMQYNTCVSRMMELTNALYKYDQNVESKNVKLMSDCVRDLMLIMAPFAPHFTEEMWSQSGYEYSIFNQEWPKYNEKALVLDTVEIAVQINGKVKTRLTIDSSLSKDEIEKLVLANENITSSLEGKTIRKVIVIPKRLVNIVAN